MATSNFFQRAAGFLTLGQDINKVSPEKLETVDGIVSRLTPELTLDTPDDDLIRLKKQWIQKWEQPSSKLRIRQDTSEFYWKRHSDDIASVGSGFDSFIGMFRNTPTQHNLPLVDNILFEALETFLPQATRKNPEPVVTADNTLEGKELADKVRKMLIHLSDILNLKLKLKTATRNWALYFVGIAKVGWSFEDEEISLSILRPQKFILDPNSTITEGGFYTGEYIGEFRKDTAAILVERFPNKKEFIRKFVQGKMGTEIQYIEWWADKGRMLFWTLKDTVLDKVRNPHWNYPGERTTVNELGDEVIEKFTGKNHFKNPQFPHRFLSIFNLGLHPYDDTSLFEQNIANQDLITKRYRQIDENVDGMNGGWAISGEKSGITKEQARAAIDAFRDGRGVWIPEGNINEAVSHIQQTGLPSDVFNQLQDARNELRGVFGVAGSTPQGTQQEQTVRGKIIRAGQDQSRIGGGVAEYIEQFADSIFNLFVQMMYVYYDEEHIASIIGAGDAQQTISLRNTDLNRDLLVSVKEGSMIPKDPLTEANQAIDLFGAGAISPLTLHKRLDDPNPQETVEELARFQSGQLAQQGTPQGGAAPGEQQRSTDLLSSVPIQ